ncbi:MAG: GAF domain-containing protein [Anaerolineae bacterium]|nr:GAF domain-containing protein [Anaerolineae bacterium]
MLVATSRPQTRERRQFRWYLLAMSLWSASASLVFIDIERTGLWFHIMISAAVSSMVWIFFFVQTVVGQKRRWAEWVYWYAGIAVFFILFTDWVVRSAYVEGGVIHYEFTPAIIFVAGPGYGLTLYSLLELAKGYRRTKNETEKNRLRYLVLGLAIVVVASLINWTPLGKYPIDVAGNGISALLIAYAILRHKLLDISVVIRKGLLYSIPTTIVGAVYFLIISLSLNVLRLYTGSFSGFKLFLVSLFVAVLTALIAQPFHQRAQLWIDRLFFREKYDLNLMLRRVSAATALVVDLDKLVSIILDDITSSLHLRRTVLLLKRGASGEYSMIASRGLEHSESLSLRHNHPVVIWLENEKSTLSRNDLDVLPFFRSLWGDEKGELERFGAELFVPLYGKGSLLGIFVFGAKLSEESYTNDDCIALMTLANQTAVAIQNALMFSEINDALKREQQLSEVAQTLSSALDLNTILSRVTRLAAEMVYADASITYLDSINISDSSRRVFDFYQKGFDESIRSEVQELSQQVLASGKSMVISRYLSSGSSAFIWKESGLRDGLCVPLVASERVIGTLSLISNSREVEFGSRDLALAEAIGRLAGVAIQNAMLYEELRDSFIQTISALANAMEVRDNYTQQHSDTMVRWAVETGRLLGCNEEQLDLLSWAALLHDIGKIGVPDEILHKPQKLTQQEMNVVYMHPVFGANIIQPVRRLEKVAPIVRAHHERYDGNGYPDRLRGENIPLEARILSAVDAYSAMIDERIYRKAYTQAEAIAELQRCAGTQFDPLVVKALIAVLGSQTE